VKKTFVEYKVETDQLAAYRDYMAKRLKGLSDTIWLESQEQSALFLEVHTNAEDNLGDRVRSDQELLSYVQNRTVRVWTFRDASQPT